MTQENDRLSLRVTVDGSGVYAGELPRVGDAPEPPEPPAWDSPFPRWPGVWIYEAIDNDAMRAWMLKNNLRWMQFWSRDYRTRKLPYTYEIQSGLHGKRGFDSDMIEVRDRLEWHSGDEEFVGVNLNCECPWTPAAEAVFEMIRADFPDVKIFTGPLGWDVLTKLDHLRRFDGVMTFWNCTRWQRMPEDFWYQAAMANAIGLPWCMSVQPVDSETGMVLANPERFKAALDLSAKFADGINLWKMEDSWKLSTGRMDTVTPDRLRPILDAIRNVKQVPAERPYLTVYHDVRDAWTFHQVRSMCRIVGRAGFEPVAVATPVEAELEWDHLANNPLFDRAALMGFSTWWPKEMTDPAERAVWRAERRAACREMEGKLAAWVAAEFGGE